MGVGGGDRQSTLAGRQVFVTFFSCLSADMKELISEQWGTFEALRFYT